ncbi:energy transducer TonB [Aliiglaciecola sp. M165]|uniref:energy transducer TonB n=1 Tax=Aliiglaciecola sp. M165 TaxID=2593649 RepID=UPI00117D96A1|nr:energy transducer TonB [Aliiglaciecola sp. M165]TRY33442.1 energy transducer TonB [Aliiglaciecola sp. M165]
MFIRFVVVTALLSISGCGSSFNNDSDMQIARGEFTTAKWKGLERFAAKYPVEAAKNNVQGCATIEYVVTPENKITDIRVVSSSHDMFAESAQEVITKWNWSKLPKYILTSDLKTQTRFEFCLRQDDGTCQSAEKEKACPGRDVIYSVGQRVG